MIGCIILGLGEVLSGWTVHTLGGLFITAGLIMGVGTSMIFMVSSRYSNDQSNLFLTVTLYYGRCSLALSYQLNTSISDEVWLLASCTRPEE
jgi:hypothetical protein